MLANVSHVCAAATVALLSAGVVYSGEKGPTSPSVDEHLRVTGTIHAEHSAAWDDQGVWIGVFPGDLAVGHQAASWTLADGPHFDLAVVGSTVSTVMAVKREYVPLLIDVPVGFSGDLGVWHLRRGVSIMGSVRSMSGDPIPQAIVSISQRTVDIEMPQRVAPTWATGPDGTFAASGFLPGAYHVLVTAQGYVPWRSAGLKMDRDGESGLDITLHKGHAISGRVVDEFGASVQLAEVAVTGDGFREHVQTDADGRFDVYPIPEGALVILSVVHTIGSARLSGVDSAATDVTVVLRRGITVSGAVSSANGEAIDQFTVKSIAGSVVLSSRTFYDTTSFVILSDRETHAISISAPGFVGWSASVNAGRISQANIDVGNVILERANRILRGHIIDRGTGNGIAGAYVTHPMDGQIAAQATTRPHAKTDAAGRFEIGGLPSSRPISLLASASGYARRRVRAAPQEQLVTIELDPGGSVSGVLVTSDGAPVAGTVRLVEVNRDRTRPWDRDMSFGLSVDAGENGEFVFDTLPARRFRLEGKSSDGLVGELTVSLREGALSGIRLEVIRRGRVFGSISGLGPGQRVYIRVADLNQRGVSHGAGDFPNGPYELHGIPEPGEFDMVASLAGRRVTRRFEMVGLDAQVDLAMDAGYRLSGLLTFHGRPRADVEIAAEPVAGSSSTTGWGRSNGLGHYEVQGLDAGSYVLSVYGQRFEIDISGDTVYDVELADRSVSGTVRSPYPLGNIAVRAESISSGKIYRTQLDLRGQYRFDSVAPGNYKIDIRTPYFSQTSRLVSVDGALQEVDFDLQLADVSELQAFDLRSGARVSNTLATVTVQGGELDALAFDVLLDPEGVVQLPTTLAGGNLTLSSAGYRSAVIPRWDGQPLVIQLTPLAPE